MSEISGVELGIGTDRAVTDLIHERRAAVTSATDDGSDRTAKGTRR